MKKNSNRGFMLIETLLVSTFVLGVLTFLFMQFSALKRSYDDSFKYDTVPALYGMRNVHQYIVKNGGYNSIKSLVDSTSGYATVSCSNLSNPNTCLSLFNDLDVAVVYLVNDLAFKGNVNINTHILKEDNELYHFVKKIKYSTNSGDYHLIVKFSDNTFATMAIQL